MAFLADGALDALLDYVRTNGLKLHICSAPPSSYANVAAVTLGYKASPSIGANGDATPNGRKATVAAITGGTVTASGTASHVALVNEGSSLLLSWSPLTASQAVTSGNQFTLGAFDVRVPDAA